MHRVGWRRPRHRRGGRIMLRAIFCALTLTLILAVSPAVRAGELDREAGATAAPAAGASATGGSELDRESPQSAHGWRWGGAYHGGWGWGGFYRAPYFSFGYSPFYSYSFYRPFGFYGYYNAFAYPYFSAYYSPFVYPY